MSNINQKVAVIPTLVASGADVVLANGVLNITGVDAIPVRNIQSGTLIASLGGLAVPYTITSTAAVAGSTLYEGWIQQTVEGRTYNGAFSYTTPASAPSDTNFYLALETRIQALITGGQLLGTVTSSSGGVVFTGTVVAPQAAFGGSNLSIAAGAKTLTAAGSSATNAAPRVFTAGAVHGLPLNKIYRVTFSGVTSTGAADMNRTLYAIATGTSDLTLLGTSATGAVVTTSATITVSQDGIQDFSSDGGQITGFSTTYNYVGVDLTYLSNNEVVAGVAIPQMVLADATNNSVADVNAFVLALVAALDGSNAAEMSAAL